MKILFPGSYCKKGIVVIATTILLGIMFTVPTRKAKFITASPLLDPAVEQEGRRTAPPTTERSKAGDRKRCQHRLASLDWPKAGKNWHSGGWAVSQLCKQPLDTLFFVHSAPNNWKRRADLRATLFEEAACTAFNWTAVFFIGEDDDPKVNLWTRFEVEVFGDIVMLRYNDTFLTLTYKFVGGMQWVTENCPNVSTIVKIDDDVSVHPLELRRYLDEKLPQKNSSIHCNVLQRNPVHRDPHHRYCIPEDEVAQDTYPLMCSGCCIIMTIDTMRKLLRASEIAKAYAIDDAYVSGHLALIANVAHVMINSKVFYNV
ncbi:acetylgalactosaminyl-O-glycosyl-glycoprotein beta-1,3-N-acetylglucosaminyltransferase [Dermacentor silvarum]|uniref:acetylgalactosaminyl-O-glycosyl-glycoprotein beta-1,3-N-acetylglucosaminyltransferase n=1 Tax=Dermacentor silvarum TaxID=543639 RepID=UPI00189B2640|nr:acetylgalactosaminyl-O-glycosyl-glycoprotein beta-1,3-N-acetylglucosaminyltransferase [Dermacentor silvarum]